MTEFDTNYRPISQADAQARLIAMPRGHYYALGETGRNEFASGASWNEAMERVADEPTDQELFEIANAPLTIFENIANIHIKSDVDLVEVTVDGAVHLVDASDISEVEDIDQGIYGIFFGDVLSIDSKDLDPAYDVDADLCYEGKLVDGRSIKITPVASLAAAA